MERQISQPKKVLINMRRTCSFLKTKLLLLCKLNGLDWLREVYDSDLEKDRVWQKNYHLYPNQATVLKKFLAGKDPICCFFTSDEQCVARIVYRCDKVGIVHMISFRPIVGSLSKEECGLHFCEFESVKDCAGDIIVREEKRSELEKSICAYAIMLPLKRPDVPFLKQYSLAYWDWDVLCPEAMHTKGPPAISVDLFDEMMM